MRWCLLPREVALRSHQPTVPCRDTLPGTGGSLPAPAPAAPGTCQAINLQPCRGMQEGAPVPARGRALNLSLCSLGFFFQHVPRSGVPERQLYGDGRSMAVGVSRSRLPAGIVLGGCLKKPLAPPKTKPTEARAHSWTPWENTKGEERRERKGEGNMPPCKGGKQVKPRNQTLKCQWKSNNFSLIPPAGKGSAQFLSLPYSSRAH